MTKIIPWELISKYFKGTISSEEKESFERWIQSSKRNHSIFLALREEWEATGIIPSDFHPDKVTAWNNILSSIIIPRIKREYFKKKYSFSLASVAAIFLIPVLATSIWFYLSLKSHDSISEQQIASGWVKIDVPDGARIEFLLPDSSSGWLNSRATLKYPVVFDKHRKVELTGEAYFSVKHIDQSDFIVSIPDMDIKVLGTKFNVSAYANAPYTFVVLEEGIVEVDGKTGVFNQRLLPNEKILFNHKSNTLKLSKVKATRYSAWKDGYLIIENERLGEVVSRIERWYNIKIVIEDKELNNYRVRATFKDEPIEEVLKLLSITIPLKYNIEKRVADSRGVVKQKKVIMKLK
jgi:ferric-dicitrate binding protein FerR (iron transport regulator)